VLSMRSLHGGGRHGRGIEGMCLWVIFLYLLSILKVGRTPYLYCNTSLRVRGLTRLLVMNEWLYLWSN
jgi:hypothetical protein